MFIRGNLFNTGHPLKAEPGLSDALEKHKRGILKNIHAISDLDQMTDAFLESMVTKSLVVPLAIQLDKMTRKLRTETFDGGNQKQVARLTIPFSGEEDLLKFSPIPCNFAFPQGEVYGKTIQFDVILWGKSDDAQRVKDEVQKNCNLIADYAAKINQQVKVFNDSVPAQVKAAFTAKLEDLTKQHAVFDDLGIPEEPDPRPSPLAPSTPPPKKRREARAVQIIQHIDTMFVQQLNQTNYNGGDVNNAIQSAE